MKRWKIDLQFNNKKKEIEGRKKNKINKTYLRSKLFDIFYTDI